MREPVEEGVQGPGAGVEVGDVDGVSLVGVEPVGRPEHREEKDDEGFVLQRVVEPVQLRFPRRVLHHNNPGSIAANDLLRITEQESQAGTKEHQHNKSNIRSIGDGGSFFDVDIRTKRDLLPVH